LSFQPQSMVRPLITESIGIWTMSQSFRAWQHTGNIRFHMWPPLRIWNRFAWICKRAALNLRGILLCKEVRRDVWTAEYLQSVSLPDVTKVRSERGIEQEEVALLLDNCPSHLARDVMDMFTAVKVRMVTFTRINTHLPTPPFRIICDIQTGREISPAFRWSHIDVAFHRQAMVNCLKPRRPGGHLLCAFPSLPPIAILSMNGDYDENRGLESSIPWD
jgi:hypothetical protein